MPVSQLAHLVFEVSDLPAWRELADRVLGLRVEPQGSGWSLRLDERQVRIQLVEGPADDLIALGWEVADADQLEVLRADLARAGTPTNEDPAAASERAVERLVWFTDPAGCRVELVVGPHRAEQAFSSRRIPGGFVTGDEGLGHVVLHSNSRAESETFYREQLGLSLSDRIVLEHGEHHIDLVFLHANSRHHSLALGGPLDRRLHHFALQLGSLDDLGRACDRAARAGLIAAGLGRHPNDLMVSFYLRTPSGFQIELGWGGVHIDEAWQPTTHDRIALWGHRPPPASAQESTP